MLLAERLRSDEEKAIVREVLETHIKAKLDVLSLYSQRNEQQLQAMLEKYTQQSTEDMKSTKDVKSTEGKQSTTENQSTSTTQSTSTSTVNEKEASLRGNIAWTRSMCRLFTLVERCIQHKEPVLLGSFFTDLLPVDGLFRLA